MSNFNYLVGAEIGWFNGANYEDSMKLVSPNGNVVKLQIDMLRLYWLNDQKFKDMVSSLEASIKIAQENELFVIINLWNTKYIHELIYTYIKDENVLKKYLDEHLDMLVDKLSIYDNIAAWNLFDEPEELIYTNDVNPEICLNANLIPRNYSDQDKYRSFVRIDQVQKFIALQAQKIHQKAPGHLVTVTISDTAALSYWQQNKIGFNHFEDKCLNLVMDNKCNKNECILDFYSIIVSKDTMKDPNFENFNQTYISKESVKPVVLIAGSNNELEFKSFIDKVDVGLEY